MTYPSGGRSFGKGSGFAPASGGSGFVPPSQGSGFYPNDQNGVPPPPVHIDHEKDLIKALRLGKVPLFRNIPCLGPDELRKAVHREEQRLRKKKGIETEDSMTFIDIAKISNTIDYMHKFPNVLGLGDEALENLKDASNNQRDIYLACLKEQSRRYAAKFRLTNPTSEMRQEKLQNVTEEEIQKIRLGSEILIGHIMQQLQNIIDPVTKIEKETNLQEYKAIMEFIKLREMSMKEEKKEATMVPEIQLEEKLAQSPLPVIEEFPVEGNMSPEIKIDVGDNEGNMSPEILEHNVDNSAMDVVNNLVNENQQTSMLQDFDDDGEVDEEVDIGENLVMLSDESYA